MRLPSSYVIEVPDTAGIILPMESDKTSTLNTTEQNLSSLAGDATLTAMGTNNLTITPGSGRWVLSRPFRSGYLFDGAATGMTKAAWTAVHNLPSLSLEVCFIPENTTAVTRFILGSFVDGINYVGLVQSGTSCFATVCDGVAEFKATVTGALTAGHLHVAFLTWDKTDNDGKVTCTVYDVDDDSLGTADSATGTANNSSSNDNLWMGCRDGATQFFKGVICKGSLYANKKLTAAELATLYNREATCINDVTYLDMWELASQIPGGTTAYSTAWRRDGGHGRSIFFLDSSNTYLSVADDADLEIGAGDFTVAFKILTTTLGAQQKVLNKASSMNIIIETDGDLSLTVVGGGIDTNTTTTQPIAVNTWYSVVVKRTSHVVAIYVDGASQALDSAVNDETMAGNANAWTIGGDGTDGVTGRISLFLFDPSTAYSDQWCKDFFYGLPTIPVQEDPIEGSSKLSFPLIGSGYEARFDSDALHNTQVLCWIGDASKGPYPLFWRGRLSRSIFDPNLSLLDILCSDVSESEKREYDATYGRDAGTYGAITDLATVHTDVAGSEVTATHTPSTIGTSRLYSISRGMTRADVIRLLYMDQGIPGHIDAWGDHWWRPRLTYPSGFDDWGESHTEWPSTSGVVSTDATTKVYGTNSVKVTAVAAAELIFDVWKVIDLNTEDFPYISLYWEDNATQPIYIRLETDAANYYQILASTQVVTAFTHEILRLPDANSVYFWDTTGSPDYTDINKIRFISIAQTDTDIMRIDAIHFLTFSDPYPAAVINGTTMIRQPISKVIDGYASTIYVHVDGDTAGVSGTVDLPSGEYVTANVTSSSKADGWSQAYEEAAFRMGLYDYAAPIELPFNNDLLRLRRGDPIHIVNGADTDRSYIASITHNIPSATTSITIGKVKAAAQARARAGRAPPGAIRVPPPPISLSTMVGGRAIPAIWSLQTRIRLNQPLTTEEQALFNTLDPRIQDTLLEADKYKRRYHA